MPTPDDLTVFPSGPADPAIADLHAAWARCERDLDELKAAFRAAVQAFVADRSSPDPIRLLSQLGELQKDCNETCRALLLAVKSAEDPLSGCGRS